jgi:hypothetical protein
MVDVFIQLLRSSTLIAWNFRLSITVVSLPPYPTLCFNGIPTRLLGINASLVFSHCASCLCKLQVL